MKAFVLSATIACGLPISGMAHDLTSSQTLYDQDRIETSELLVVLGPVNQDVRFSITLRDKITGLERRHEFDGEGANDPSPFLLKGGYYCSTSIILLTVKFPWRHALPLYSRVLQTYAFRVADFALIDVTYGPLTDIALHDGSGGEPETEMSPTVGVHCLEDPAGTPFRFIRREAN